MVFTPVHTAACVSLLYRPDQALFSGNNLAWWHSMQQLTISVPTTALNNNWHSVAQQLDSVAALRRRQLGFWARLLPARRRADFSDSADVDRGRQLDSMLAAEGYSGQPESPTC